MLTLTTTTISTVDDDHPIDDSSACSAQDFDWCIPQYVYVEIFNADLFSVTGKLRRHDFAPLR